MQQSELRLLPFGGGARHLFGKLCRRPRSDVLHLRPPLPGQELGLSVQRLQPRVCSQSCKGAPRHSKVDFDLPLCLDPIVAGPFRQAFKETGREWRVVAELILPSLNFF